MSGELFGRERELGRLRILLDGARSHGDVLLLRGGPGAGKTSLLESAMSAAAARQMEIITVKGAQLETRLPFAGLHQLVHPLLGRLSQLPAPQRNAVEAAFGIAATARPDPFLIALGLLNLLPTQAATAPLLVAVDDAQWLDRASSEVLAIMASRLRPMSAVLIAAARAHPESPLTTAGLPALDLEPLDAATANALLSASFPGLGGTERERVLANAGGNPLAILELPKAFRAEQLSNRGTLPSLTPRLERAFATADLGLTDATRVILLTAAASDTGGLDEVIRATEVQVAEPVTADWLTPAIRARLVRIEDTAIRFSSPVAHSVVYAEASPPERRAAHTSLAKLLAGQPERQAWHHAATVTGPDEAVAEQLELAAGLALQRGAVAAAVAATERAATLTAEPTLRGSRLLHTAELSLELGRNDMVRHLTLAARSLPLRDTDQIKAEWLERIVDPELSFNAGSSRMLAELADQARRAGASDLALTILCGAAFCYFWAGHDRQLGHSLLADLRSLPVSAEQPLRLAALAVTDPVGQAERVTEGIFRLERHIRNDASAAYEAGVSALIVGEVNLAESLLAAAVTQLRAHGRIRLLARALTVQAWAAAHLADWAAANSAARDGVQLAAETDQPLYVTIGEGALLLMAALRGDVDGSSASPAEQRLAVGGGQYGLAVRHAARGLSALGDGRYSEAHEHLRRIFDPDDPACHYAQQYWYVHDFVEAAVRSGHLEDARACLSALEPGQGVALSPRLSATFGYARALLAEDDHAEKLFLDAIYAAVGVPFIRARAQLAYGSWLRRQRRSAESRDPLRAAATSFDTLGYRPWAARAGQELRASGEAVPAAAAHAIFSPQELKIAELAASGLTNRQIGRQLYLSPRTVATHLYRLFPKLGISSRSQLREALSNPGNGLAGPTADFVRGK